MSYAAGTTVSVEQSRVELERTLTRYGATAFAFAIEQSRHVVMFEARDRRIRFVLTLPSPTDRRFTHSKTGQRTAIQAANAHAQEVRRLWRALNLIVKSKLEAIESGVVQFDTEFLAHLCTASGRTVAEEMGDIGTALNSSSFPSMLALGAAR